MTIATRVFFSSMSFGFIVAAAYWLSSREPVGTILLGLFGAGFLWIAGYLIALRPKAPLDGDLERVPADLAGEQIGVFSVESPWPIILALSTAGLLVGIVLHPMLAIIAATTFLAIIWALAKESV